MTRNTSTRFTIEVYTEARIEAKRQAQQRLVQTILSEENDGLAPRSKAIPMSRWRDRDLLMGRSGWMDFREHPMILGT